MISRFVVLAVSFVVGVVTAAQPVQGSAEEFTIGVDELPSRLNILEGEGISSLLLRRLITVGLVRRASEYRPATLHLGLADSLSVSADTSTVSFRLRQGRTFTDGTAVEGEDAFFSLQRCLERGDLSGVAAVRLDGDGGRSWVRLSLKPGQFDQSLLFQGVAECPILQRRSSEIFGPDLGFDSNLVASGDYLITDLRPGFRYRVDRFGRGPLDPVGMSEIHLRFFDAGDKILAALRAGTIFGAILRDEESLERAKKDETLEVESCSIYSVVRRRGVVFPCVERLEPTSIGVSK